LFFGASGAETIQRGSDESVHNSPSVRQLAKERSKPEFAKGRQQALAANRDPGTFVVQRPNGVRQPKGLDMYWPSTNSAIFSGDEGRMTLAVID
jgi:hypothetical protein